MWLAIVMMFMSFTVSVDWRLFEAISKRHGRLQRAAQGCCAILVIVAATTAPWCWVNAQPFLETKLIAPDGAELDQFGSSVAISGGWAAVGAAGRDDLGENSGAVYMFRKSNGQWRFSQKLFAGDGTAGDLLAGVSLDGDYLAASAGGARHNGVRSGAVYIFKRLDTTWIQMRKIGPEPPASGAFFGLSRSLKGSYLLIGAHLDREAGIETGAAYVFKKNGEDWVQEARLLASDRKERHWFGYTVSLLDSLALVGAPLDSNRNGESAGAGYLFQKAGAIWLQTSKLIASGGLPEDFAGSVAMDYGHLIVGAPGSILVSRPGLAYSFVPPSIHRQTVSARDGIDRNGFGARITIRSGRMTIKASGDTAQGVGAGAAYLFSFEDGAWTQKYKFLASDGAAGANYGECAMSDSSVIIGALNATVGGVRLRGAAYIYEPVALDAHEIEPTPGEFWLHQNFPNPFNPTTEIRWQIPSSRWVTLKVYDLLGREVNVLVNEPKAAGEYSTVFDADGLASGVYYYRLIAGASHQTKRMLVLK
jgi:hypothetical protein